MKMIGRSHFKLLLIIFGQSPSIWGIWTSMNMTESSPLSTRCFCIPPFGSVARHGDVGEPFDEHSLDDFLIDHIVFHYQDFWDVTSLSRFLPFSPELANSVEPRVIKCGLMDRNANMHLAAVSSNRYSECLSFELGIFLRNKFILDDFRCVLDWSHRYKTPPYPHRRGISRVWGNGIVGA